MTQSNISASFRYAFRRSIPILIGFFPVGIAYGILMNNIGYHFLWSSLTSLIVYAGSLQFLMVSFFQEGTPLITIAVMALLLNSRHIFYGLSFLEKFRDYGPWKYFLIYGLSDESYSLLCSYEEKEGAQEKWVHLFSTMLLCLYWIAFSGLGGLAGSLITFNTAGIDFALTSLFIVILIEQLKSRPSPLPAILSAASAILCILLFGRGQFLLPSLTITVTLLVLFRRQLDDAERREE